MNLFPETVATDDKVSQLFKTSNALDKKATPLIKVQKIEVIKKTDKDADGDEKMEDAASDDAKVKKPSKKKLAKKNKETKTPEQVPEEPEKLVEEGKEAKKSTKEDEIEKASRTIFVGNLSNEVIISKSTYKLFQKLFNNIDDDDENKKLPIQSIRFRSVSFEDALPRKVAFVQQKLHKSRASVNAYIVYKEQSQLLNKLIKRLNGQVFSNRHLRVDSITHPAPHDKQRSVFVGNLDFEEDEESLWKHFGACGSIEYVRIVRDPKTNMGKGFAYVQFNELQSVSKALLLNEKPMISQNEHLKKRKLRVTRCKNIRKVEPTLKSGKYMTDGQKTKLGRAKKILNKAERSKLLKELTVEGIRATKDDSKPVLKKGKKERSKTGRVTKRSQAFKKSQQKK